MLKSNLLPENLIMRFSGISFSKPYLSLNYVVLYDIMLTYIRFCKGRELMHPLKSMAKDTIFTIAVLAMAFFLILFLQRFFETQSIIPMIFVLGVFFISLKTQAITYGIVASLIGVLLVNYAFTYPYYAFDLISPECVSSAVIMLIVAIMTGILTSQIKKQEKIKAESDKEHMRANLLRAVSHDLRTPLTTIYGSCTAIIENYNSLDEKQKQKLLSEIKEDSEWLIRMVENLLSVTRIDSQKVEVKKFPTVLEELIDTVLLKFRKRCPDKNIQIDIPDEFVMIPMDAMLIEQVLINILENAVVHAVGMTELKLQVSVKNKHALFCISDNGCGVDPSKLPHLFTGYLDTEEAITDGTRNNMGIGLSVCSAIIKAHGSEIFVQNLKTGGASFSFSLELEE